MVAIEKEKVDSSSHEAITQITNDDISSSGESEDETQFDKLLRQVKNKGFADDIHAHFTDQIVVSSTSDTTSDEEDEYKRKKAKKLRLDKRDGSDSRKEKKHKKKEKKKKRKQEKDLKRKYKFKYKRKLDLKRERENQVPEHHRSKIFYGDIDSLQPEAAFRYDHTGDNNNLAYGSIYQKHIARRTLLSRECVTQPGTRSIYIDEGKAKSASSKDRYFTKENTKRIKQQAINVSQICDTKIPAGSQAGEKAGALKDQTPDVLPLTCGIIEELQIKEDEVMPDAMGYDAIKTQVEFYNRTLRENPGDIRTWLEWIEFQPKCINFNSFARNKSEVDERKPVIQSVYDVQLSILSKSILKNPSNLELQTKRLEVGREMWDQDTLLKEWKALLFQHANRADLWKKYLLFRQSHHHSFTVSSCLKAYTKCLETLQGILEGTMTSHPPLPNMEYHMIEIFSDMCLMLWRAGHTEKAIAQFQAMLEFNLHCPAVLSNASHAEKVEFLEAYWGSTAHHLGEDGAQGWHAWVAAKGAVPARVPWSSKEKEEEHEEKLLKEHQNSDSSQIWIALEQSRGHTQWLPWRANLDQGETDEDCEDPDRLVLSDDVTSCLFTVTSDNLRFELICSFLRLLGMEIESMNSTEKVLCFEDSSDMLLTAFSSINVVKETRKSTANLENMEKFILKILEQLSPGLIEPYRTIMLKATFEYKFAQLENNVNAKKDGKSLKKWMKQLLKKEENRNNLVLWEGLANLEWKLGNQDDSIKVLHTALCSKLLVKKDPRSMTFEDMLVCHVSVNLLAKILVRSTSSQGNDSVINRQDICAKLLYYVINSEQVPILADISKAPLSSTDKLKTKHMCEAILKVIERDDHMPEANPVEYLKLCHFGDGLVWITCCLAYYQYCSENIASASQIFKRIIHKMQDNLLNESFQENDLRTYCKMQLKQLHTGRVKLAEFHTALTPVSFKILREPLLESLNVFPEDTTFLEKYVNLEIKAGLSRDLRSFFHRKSSVCADAQIWIFAAIAELERVRRLEATDDPLDIGVRIASNSGISHQVRAWFERGVTHPHAKYCTLLWRLYSYFEKGKGELEQAEAVLYRALQICPASKELYMDLIKLCPRRLADTIDMMVEKELRLRTPYEELQLLTKASAAAETLSNVEETSSEEKPSAETLSDVEEEIRPEAKPDGLKQDNI